MSILTPVVLGAPFNGTVHNANLTLIEGSLSDIGPYVISGIVPSIGTGLSVNVTSGVALIGGRVTVSSFTIGSLTPSTTNHLYLLNTGAVTSNTTGTAPANSVKLGTALCGVATVTSVDTSVASGRQEKGMTSSSTFGTLTVTTLTVATITGSGNTTLTKAPDATANYGVLSVGNGGFTGGAGHYAGGAGGSLIGVNLVSGGTADLLNLQINGVSKWKVGSGGNVTLGDGTNIVGNTGTGNMLGTTSSQKWGFYGATPVAQISGTTDLVAGFVTQGLRAASGAVPCNLNGGDLTANQGFFSGALKGSGTALTFGRLSFTFPSDADHTLDTTERANMILDVQTGVITATRAIIVPGSAGSSWHVINRNAFPVTIKTAASAGITVGATRSRVIDFPGGTVAFSMGSDNDYSV